MADVIDNLLLEHLKRFQATLDRMDRKLEDVIARMGRLEVGLANVHRDISYGEGVSAEQSVRMDRLAGRVERIERRLELHD
jgi:uncharacterized protein (UPF0335 family)